MSRVENKKAHCERGNQAGSCSRRVTAPRAEYNVIISVDPAYRTPTGICISINGSYYSSFSSYNTITLAHKIHYFVSALNKTTSVYHNGRKTLLVFEQRIMSKGWKSSITYGRGIERVRTLIDCNYTFLDITETLIPADEWIRCIFGSTKKYSKKLSIIAASQWIGRGIKSDHEADAVNLNRWAIQKYGVKK